MSVKMLLWIANASLLLYFALEYMRNKALQQTVQPALMNKYEDL
jgi:hypothetical protein